MLVASTPETTNPVSDQCEVNGTPAISSVCPWQPWFFARGGKPDVGFKSTYHFFWGLEDIIGVFIDMWNSMETNKVVGALWPNDGDGNAWGDKERGFPPALAKAGYKVIDPGRYPNLSDDFSAQIATFKNEKVEIVTGRADPARLDDVLEAGRPAGLPPQGGQRSARRCSSRARWRRSATSATACPPRCGGRRSTRSSRR